MKFLSMLALCFFTANAFAGPAVIWGSPYPLIISGGIKMQSSDTTTTCNAAAAGALRYNAGTHQSCNGSAWTSLGSGGSSATAFYASISWVGAANCFWTISSAASLADFPVDTDCTAPTVVTGAALTANGGSVAAPGTKVPQMVFTNLPAGEYEVVATGRMASDAATPACFYQISDGTNVSGLNGGQTSTSTQSSPMTLTGRFNYGSIQGSLTFKIQGGGGVSGCYLTNDKALGEFKIMVYRIS